MKNNFGMMITLVCVVVIAAAALLASMNRGVHAASADRIADLEARLASLETKEEIRELFNRYGFTADTGDAKGWSETWAQDAVYDGNGFQIKGREAFFKSIEDPNATHKKEIEGKGSLHTTGSVTIRVDGQRAWVEGPTIVWVKNNDTYRAFSMSYNHWDLQKTNGRWEILKRISRPVAPGNAPQVFTAWKTAQ